MVIVVNGSYDDSRYYLIRADDMITALELFIIYAQENDIDLDHPYALKKVTEEDTIIVVN